MGDFDETLAWLRQRRKMSAEDLSDIAGGTRHFRNDEDITEEIKERAEEDIARFDILIAAYESRVPNRP